MAWWEWAVAVIWGPTTALIVVALLAVMVERIRGRIARRRPVTVDRRRPEGARLREMIGSRGRVGQADGMLDIPHQHYVQQRSSAQTRK